MHFSLTWFQEIFNCSLSAHELAEDLTRLGLEVDAVTRIQSSFEGLIVGKVLDVKPHPEADRLQIATVFDGSEELQVVCGAKNCRANLLTVLCPIGSSLEDKEGKRHKIKKGKIRGVESFGMLASAEEMNIAEESDGIIELTDNFVPGEDVRSFCEDEILEISFTPNLGHAMSVIGIAREISALKNIPFSFRDFPLQENPKATIDKHVSLHVEDKEGCPHYRARLIANVEVGPSPLWLQQRLKACGIKSINNVVDATNYVLHEMGHPLHAFDLDKIEGGEIRVQSAKEELSFRTLDGIERKVSPQTLLICDGQKPVAIAGVMGGENSAVSEETRNILLEAAVFNPKQIRRASKSLGLYTDASKKFERGVDTNALQKVLDRAAGLIVEIAGGQIAQGVLLHTSPSEPKTVEIRPEFVNRLLGTKLEPGEMIEILDRLDFQTKMGKDKTIIAHVPSYRNDIGAEIDFVEEIARFYGFDKICQTLPSITLTELQDEPLYQIERKVHSRCREAGLQEILTCDLISPSMEKMHLHASKSLTALNSVSMDQSVLRTSLFANHLHVIKHNQSHQIHNLKLYEIGKVYENSGEQYNEETKLAISLIGRDAPFHFQKEDNPVDFLDLKGILENLFESLGIEGISFTHSNYVFFHPGIQCQLKAGNTPFGFAGEVHPSRLREVGIKQPVLFCEVSLPSLLALAKPLEKIEPISAFPKTERDWTLTCLEDLEVGHLLQTIKEMDSRLLKEVTLMNIYRSESVGAARKNVTLRFVYRNDKKTISFEATEIEHAKITSDVLKKMKNLIIQPN